MDRSIGEQMKRVLHVLHSLERSGMEIMLLNSSEEWRRHGYQCDAVATANREGPVSDQLRTRAYRVYHHPFRSRWSLLPRPSFVRDFLVLCRSGYDVVHIHAEGGAPLFALLAKLAGVRRVAVTPHNTFRFRGWLRIRKICERHFVRLLGGRYGMISEGVVECEKERFHNRGVRIWNWIDTEHFRASSQFERLLARLSLGARCEDFVIVSIGNCNEIKNHGAILRAIPLLPAAIRPLYVHIGREQPDCPEQRLAAKLGILDKVRFLGSVEDPLQFLWAADAFVMPSLHEGLGIAALEAAAAGAPLVCSGVDGLSDVAAAMNHAILTTTDPESVAQGISLLASLPISQLREQALEDSRLVRSQFSVRHGVRSVVSGLYAEDRLVHPIATPVWRRP
jgi:glycosyltransferase involved in cell wall biosynthesis